MLHHVISHGLVDQVGKSFNIADEFMIHVFKAHVIACSHEWLKLTAKEIVENHTTISFTQCTIYIIPPAHKVCVQDSIRTHYQTMETLGHIFLARNRRNYANKALNLLANINATLPNNVKLHTSSHTITRLTNKRIDSKLTK